MPLGEKVKLQLAKSVDAHKFSHGHALVLTGGAGQGGAARLAARGALRIGAGIVSVACPPTAFRENAGHLDAIMCAMFEGTVELASILKDPRINAICAGPGLGFDRARALIPVVLKAKRATVLDADALSAFQGDPKVLFDMLYPNCVLTPHAGEFKRLFPDIFDEMTKAAVDDLGAYKRLATVAAAERAGCTVLFKGADTVIASPDGRVSPQKEGSDRAAPWLATAGSGDVLAGFITGLLARGFDVQQAAETSAWLHVACALKFGPGLVSEDLPEMLPKVFQDLGI